MKQVLLAVSLYGIQEAAAQSLFQPFSPIVHIGTYSKHFTGPFSGAANQAALAVVDRPAAGVYGERRFMLQELSSYHVSAVLPAKNCGFGLVVGYTGHAGFNESQVGLGYGKKLGDKLSAGIQFNYHMLRIAGYGSSAAVSAALGLLFFPDDRFCWGLQVFNPAGARFGRQEKLPAVFTSAIGYEASENFFIGADIIKTANQPIDLFAGFQYHFEEQFFLRAAIGTAVGNYAAGAGLKWKNCRVDMITGYHPQLGFTPGLQLQFDFNGEVKTKSE